MIPSIILTLLAAGIFFIGAICSVYKRFSIIADILDKFSIEDAAGGEGKKKAGIILAKLFDTYPPKEQVGGTITKEWLDSIHRLRYDKRSGLKKQNIVRKMVGRKHINDVEEHLSQGPTGGSTVAGQALWMIYDTELRRRKWILISSFFVIIGSLTAIGYHIIHWDTFL